MEPGTVLHTHSGTFNRLLSMKALSERPIEGSACVNTRCCYRSVKVIVCALRKGTVEQVQLGLELTKELQAAFPGEH